MKYYVSVDGREAPLTPHSSYDSSLTEAKRLAALPANKFATVRVFVEIATLTPKSEHKLTEFSLQLKL